MTSTLDLTGEEDPVIGIGHGTRALGPSDSSDTGSDVVGGPGMDEGLSDEQARRMPLSAIEGAGRDVGDEDLVSDSDSGGTGERGSSGTDTSIPNDQQLTIRSEGELTADLFDDLDAPADEDVAGEGSAAVDDGAT